MGSAIDAWLHNVGACRLSVGGMRPKQAGVVLGLRVLGLRVCFFETHHNPSIEVVGVVV